MTIDPVILSAVTELITEGDLAHQAVLVGGQAIRDWHAQQTHYQRDPREGLPMPRVSMDIDVVILLTSDGGKFYEALNKHWVQFDLPHAYQWRRNGSITLDLVASRGKGNTQGQIQISRSTGRTTIPTAGVLRPWIIGKGLLEECFDQTLRAIHLRRLNHLGLISAKLSAIYRTIKVMWDCERQGKLVPEWTERLPRDIKDATLLLDRSWRSNISFSPAYPDSLAVLEDLRSLIGTLCDVTNPLPRIASPHEEAIAAVVAAASGMIAS